MEGAPTDFLIIFSLYVFNQIGLKMCKAKPLLHTLLGELFS